MTHPRCYEKGHFVWALADWTHCFFGPIEPLGLVKALACAGSLGQDMTGQDTRQDLGSAGLSAAIITKH